MRYVIFSVVCALAAIGNCQQAGQLTPEFHPPLPIQSCDETGCQTENTGVVLDGDYRRFYSVADSSVYCQTSEGWDPVLCPDGVTCAQNCAVDGITEEEYNNGFGIFTSGSTLRINYYTETDWGYIIGPRIFLIGDDDKYRLFFLKNRELSVTADVSTLACGMNGALTLNQIDEDGGMARYPSSNSAGAKYGTGYCDGQCIHYLKLSNGQVNMDGNSDYGICCTEMDIFETNRWACSYTPHGCTTDGYYVCTGVECGDDDDYFNGVCDKAGCENSPARQNNRLFFGYNETFTIDTNLPFTAVTQFVTNDGTDTGALVEIRRIWYQNGVEIPNPIANWGYAEDYDSTTDEFCEAYKTLFGEFNDFAEQGGLAAMDAALQKGMVMVFALWEDSTTYMQWLDSLVPADGDPSVPGVYRGPCPVDAGNPEDNHVNNRDAFLTFSDIKIGTIGSTI